MMYPDALSIAVNVIDAYAEQTGQTPTWWDVSIYRTLTGTGWLVSATQSALILDKWLVAA